MTDVLAYLTRDHARPTGPVADLGATEVTRKDADGQGKGGTLAVTQKEITAFYDSMVFPSRISHRAYRQLSSDVVSGGDVVGDFGCGQSLFYEALKYHAPAPIFLDISARALHSIDYGARVIGNICQLPVKAGSFDVIFCIGVIHHLPDMRAAFQELAGAIKSSGVIVVGVYAPDAVPAHLKRIYGRVRLTPVKRLLGFGTAVAAWCSLTLHGAVEWNDAKKRAADLLDTPLVHYLQVTEYEAMSRAAGLIVVRKKRLASMMIFWLRPVDLHSGT
jgi:SAM-dependent methyltransferase